MVKCNVYQPTLPDIDITDTIPDIDSIVDVIDLIVTDSIPTDILVTEIDTTVADSIKVTVAPDVDAQYEIIEVDEDTLIPLDYQFSGVEQWSARLPLISKRSSVRIRSPPAF